MVLPGIQALFGFQLIAVFNPGFTEKLSRPEQWLHLTSIVLIVVAIALVMAPAALHRQSSGPYKIDERFIRISSRLLVWSMAPLALGISLEVFLVARLIVGTAWPGVVLTLSLFGLFIGLWSLLPRWDRRRGRGA